MNLANLDFSVYVALAFLLYAIRRATKVPKKYLPIIGVVLGIGLAAFEKGTFSFEVVMIGIKYAIYAVVLLFSGKFVQTEYQNRRLGQLQKVVENAAGKEQQETEANTDQPTTTPTQTNSEQSNNQPTANKHTGPNVNHRY